MVCVCGNELRPQSFFPSEERRDELRVRGSDEERDARCNLTANGSRPKLSDLWSLEMNVMEPCPRIHGPPIQREAHNSQWQSWLFCILA